MVALGILMMFGGVVIIAICWSAVTIGGWTGQAWERIDIICKKQLRNPRRR